MSVGTATSALTFGGGVSAPLPDPSAPPTFGSGAAAVSAPSAGATSFAADASPTSHPTSGTGTFATAGSASDASAVISPPAPGAASATPSSSEVVLPQADAGVSWFAAGASHIDAPVQWFANYIVSDSFSAPTLQLPSFALPTATETVTAAPVGSVFVSESHEGWSGSGDSFAVSELPFTHDVHFDDMPVYTASSDTPWIFTADFTGDGWFFA